MIKKRVIGFSVFCLISASSFVYATAPKWADTPTGTLVQNARENTKQIELTELKKTIDADETDILLLDVRTPREYAIGHIPGAVNLSRGLLEFGIWSVAPEKDENIVVYCRTGARAALAAKQLGDLGYKNVSAVSTGMLDWEQKGYPVETAIANEQDSQTPEK